MPRSPEEITYLGCLSGGGRGHASSSQTWALLRLTGDTSHPKLSKGSKGARAGATECAVAPFAIPSHILHSCESCAFLRLLEQRRYPRAANTFKP